MVIDDDPAESAAAPPCLPRGPDGQVSLSGMVVVSPDAARKLSDAGWGGVAGVGSYVAVEIPRAGPPQTGDTDAPGDPADGTADGSAG